MDDTDPFRSVAGQLRALQKTSPIDVKDLADWNSAARAFSGRCQIQLPVEVMHYLHDADLRIEDPAYRAMQDRMMDGIIAALESGRLPGPTGITLSLHPRWLGVAALIAVAILYWAARG